MNKNSNHFAFSIGTLAGGGAERVILNLAGEFVRRGIKTDLLVAKYKGPLVEFVPEGVNVIELKKSGRFTVLFYLLRLPVSSWLDAIVWLFGGGPKTITRLPALLNYLRSNQPQTILSTLDAVNVTTLWAKYLSNLKTKFIVRQAIFHSQEASNARGLIGASSLPRLVKRWYPTADKIISVSNEMTEDLKEYCNVPDDRITTIYNPINLKNIAEKAEQPLDDSWFLDRQIPVVLAVGRLYKQKNYPILFEAIKSIKARREVRLVVLGEGPERDSLMTLAKNLKIEKCIQLVGHVPNPYQYMAKANVFALSSSWEGLPNVILEALACECKIVSTNCPSGPAEILEDGKYGKLVPVNDAYAMASAIEESLDDSFDKNLLQARAAEFGLDKVSEKYMAWMLN